MLRRGYPVLHKEYPEYGHSIPGDWDLVRDWIFTQEKQTPRSVTHTCETPVHGSSYWLQVRAFQDIHRKATVTASLGASAAAPSLSVHADNVACLELDVGAMPVHADRNLWLQVGDHLEVVEAPLPERLFLLGKRGAWEVTSQWEPEPSSVRGYLPGAGANLYDGEPLLIVRGTSGTSPETEMLERAAADISYYGGVSWRDMLTGRIPIKTDRETSAADLEHCNLILLGNPDQNSIVKRLFPRLPLQVKGGELLAGDRKPVSLAGAGLGMLYYNPEVPERLVYLLSTWSADAMEPFHGHGKALLAGLPDHERGDQPDLVVRTVEGLDRRRMQLDRDWNWRAIPGESRSVSGDRALTRQLTDIHMDLLLDVTAADFALWRTSGDEQREFDHEWFTLADAALARSSMRTMVAAMQGRDVAEVKARAKEFGVLLLAGVPGQDIGPARQYRVAMLPPTAGNLSVMQETFPVECGPGLSRSRALELLFRN